MAVYFPEGPVDVGDTISLGYWDGQNLFVLVDNTKDPDYLKGQDFIFMNPISATSTSITLSVSVMSKLAQFSVGGNLNSLSLKELAPNAGAYLSYTERADGTFVASRSTSDTLLMAYQSTYQNWNSPTVFLGGARYTIQTGPAASTPGSSMFFYLDGEDEPQNIAPLIMPLIYYHACSGSSCYESTTTSNAVLVAYCSLQGTVGVGNCTNIDGPAWTDIDDAAAGHVYNYCSSGVQCQTNCKAPCPDSNDSCTWDGTTFVCKLDGGSIFEGDWWTDPWFIALMIGLGLIIIIGIIVAVYVGKKKKEQKSASPGYKISGYTTK